MHLDSLVSCAAFKKSESPFILVTYLLISVSFSKIHRISQFVSLAIHYVPKIFPNIFFILLHISAIPPLIFHILSSVA